MLKILLFTVAILTGGDDAIKPEDAAKYYDQEVSVRMKVESSRLLADSNLCFLNSKRNYRDEGNLSIVIKEAGLKSLQEAKIENPASHYLDKLVVIKGKVTKYRDKPQIEITKVDQISIVDPKTGEVTAGKSTVADPAEVPQRKSNVVRPPENPATEKDSAPKSDSDGDGK